MDTNQRTANNYQINSFIKGMNSDTSYDMVGSDLYLFGQNIRITNNALLLGDLDSNNTEYVVAPVREGEVLLGGFNNPIQNVSKILATSSIDQLGAIVVENTDGTWSVVKVEYDSDYSMGVTPEVIYTSTGTVDSDKDWFSVVMIKETEDVIKLYIADGKGSPVCVFMKGGSKDIKGINEDYLRSNYYFPKSKARLLKTSGNLKTQQVQYCYRYYCKHAYVSKLSPLTNKIHVINSFRSTEVGNAEDTLTNVGFNILIPKPEYDLFDRVLLYRISYIKYGEKPQISLVYDNKFDYDSDFKTNSFFDNMQFLSILDDGSKELQSLSLDEFSALLTYSLVPLILESSQGYLFYGDVEDNTELEQSVVENVSVLYESAVATFPLNDNIWQGSADYGDGSPKLLQPKSVDLCQIRGDLRTSSISDYFKSCGINYRTQDQTKSIATYDDIFTSSLVRSLRRDEDYNYGIVFYDKFGRKTPVQNIHTESTVTHENATIFDTNGNVNVLGIGVTISGFLDSDVVGFEVVRQPKSFNTTKNLLQVALSRPIRQSKYTPSTNPSVSRGYSDYRTPYYPSVFLTTAFTYNYWGELNKEAPDVYEGNLWDKYFDYDATNVENFSLYLIFSPHINVRRTDCVSMISGVECGLVPLAYANMNVGVNIAKQLLAMAEEYNERVLQARASIVSTLETYNKDAHKTVDGVYLIHNLNFKRHDKPSDSHVVTLHTYDTTSINPSDWLTIKNVADVKNPNWEDGFSNVQTDGKEIKSAIKQYKGYTTTVGSHKYNNWASNGMYDLAATKNDTASLQGNNNNTLDTGYQLSWVYHTYDYDPKKHEKGFRGWIGPGPVCLLLETEEPAVNTTFRKQHGLSFKTIMLSLNTWYLQNVTGAAEPDDPAADLTLYNVSYENVIDLLITHNTIYHDATSGFYVKDFDDNLNATPVYLGMSFDYRQLIYNILESGELKIIAFSSESSGRPTVFMQFSPANENQSVQDVDAARFGTILCNIQHRPNPYSSLEPYCGFGNYFELPKDTDTFHAFVFDGDIYPDYAEFVNLFKTYDFNDQKRTLDSSLVVYYIPMESEINTRFDYGFNYRNTQSPNLLLEPGDITGICSQSRPLHLYNMIYSDNNNSISGYYVKQQDTQISSFPQRIAYSQLKTNGENIDNWQIFKPADFIDADSKYGNVTQLHAKDSNIYFWQTGAFGKLSVNERSLVTDNNGETIQLGQGGVLQRIDYMSTKYGMRSGDLCSIDTEDAVFWLDIKNRALLLCKQNQVVNYGENLNVQNIINKYTNPYIRPSIHYDLQSNELLCNVISNSNDNVLKQLVFNTKLGVAQSIYTRTYDDIIMFNNVIIGLETSSDDKLLMTRHNYLSVQHVEFLAPMVLKFSVNSSPSQTKVFDNQKIVILKKDRSNLGQNDLMPYYLSLEHSEFMDTFLDNNKFLFETDIHNTDPAIGPETITDREGNICYSIPRAANVSVDIDGFVYDKEYGYGGRLRGKWMTSEITNNKPEKDYCISHIVTKFRQSYN